MKIRKMIAAAAVFATAFGMGGAAQADYPEKPIKLVIPYRAGGGSDSLARTLQKAIETHNLMSQKLIVTNVEGAAGSVAARQIKDTEPDGYTFLQMHNGLLANGATGILDFGPDAFSYVAQTTQACLYLAVPASSPYKTIQDLIEGSKQNPGKIKLAETPGGVSHFPIVQLEQETGAKFGIVTTGGTAKRFAAMKGGHVDGALMSPGWIKRGGDDLRGLIWLGPNKNPAAVGMPMSKELDIDVTACLNRRFWAPKGTPPERIAYFADVLKKALDTDELKEFHAKSGADIVFRTGDDLKADVEAEYASFLKVAPQVKQAMGK